MFPCAATYLVAVTARDKMIGFAKLIAKPMRTQQKTCCCATIPQQALLTISAKELAHKAIHLHLLQSFVLTYKRFFCSTLNTHMTHEKKRE